MAFFFFLILNAVLFLRPAELVPGLIGLPIYQAMILIAMVCAFAEVLALFDSRYLKQDPVTLCVIGVLVAIILSHLRHGFFWGARYYAGEFGKTVMYYLLFVATVTSSRRLETFFTLLLVLLALMATLSLSHYSGLVHIPQLDTLTQREFDAEMGEFVSFPRLQGTGIFNDPNDFAMILLVGLILCFDRIARANGALKLIWLVPMGVFGYAILLTKSRGGILAVVTALSVLVYAKWGFRRAALCGAMLLPLVVVVFGGRQDGGVSEGTGQSRIQLWSEGFSLMKGAPIFGIGSHQFAEEVNHVAHNSFVHCFTELGLLGGTIFFGCFFAAAITLRNQLAWDEVIDFATLYRRTSTSLAILAGAGASLLTLSRSYQVPTYMVLAIASVTISLNTWEADRFPQGFDSRFVQKLCFASFALLSTTYIFTRIMVRWS